MVFSNNLLLGAVSAAAGGYLIEQSLLFNGTNQYLTRTPSTAGNRQTWTFSCWVKRGDLGVAKRIFGASIASPSVASDWTNLSFDAGDTLTLSNWSVNLRTTTAKFRDPNAWYHIAVVVDTTLATAADRVKIYVNGVQVTAFNTTNDPTQNFDFSVNNTVSHFIGRRPDTSADFFSGLMALPILVDGAALDPTSFGELDDDGYWNPIAYTGAYGTNGFVLDFADSSWFGKDASVVDASATVISASGEWTVGTASITFSGDGWTYNATDDALYVTDTFAVASWPMSYQLALNGSVDNTGAAIGLFDNAEIGTFNHQNNSGGLDAMTASWRFRPSDGELWYGATTVATLGARSINDILKFIVDADGTVRFFINEVLRHTFAQSATGKTLRLMSACSNPTSYDGCKWVTNIPGNSFTDSGFVAADQLADTPTDDADLEIGNYAILDPNRKAGTANNGTFTEANLGWTPTGGGYSGAFSTFPILQPVHIEVTIKAGFDTSSNLGFARMDTLTTPGGDFDYASWGYGIRNTGSNWKTLVAGSNDVTGMGGAYATNDRLTIEYDPSDGSVKLWVNGSALNSGSDVFTGANKTALGANTFLFYVSGYTASQIVEVNFGQKAFVDTPTTGFVALATQNLPAPTIADGSDYFNTVLYTGNGTAIGSGGNAITGVGFQPDFVWIKGRDSAYYHRLQDAVRGATKELYSNDTSAEVTDTETLASFDADGFTVGNATGYNSNTEAFVAWCWKAGGAAVSNTDGSITSSVSANATAGFSIVSYTGTGAAATVGHGLGAVPKFIICRSLDAVLGWFVYHGANTSAPETDYLILNTTAATADGASPWNDTAPTSSVFSLGTNGDTNGSTESHIAYCWAEVEGFSKFGSYTGNGSADGPFIYLGFKPAFVLIKDINSGVDGWAMEDAARDTYNPVSKLLLANSSSAELTPYNIDFLSNGFKIRTTTAGFNTNTNTMIYAAFAEVPFQGDAGVTQARAR